MRRVPVFAVLAVVLVACTPVAGTQGTTTTVSGLDLDALTTSSTTTTTQPPDGFGGELVVGTPAGVETLNPFAANALGSHLAGNAVWATVFDIDPDTWDRIPDVVTGLPSDIGSIDVAPDGSMTVRYEIRPDARWSDGVPITGDDLAFTAEAMRDLATRGVGGVDPVMATVTATDSVDRLAFITFSKATLAFEDALWIVLPEHALAGVDLVDGTDGSDWPSGGPFVVDGFDPPSSARFTRNELYWKTDADGNRLPYLDALTITEAAAGSDTNQAASPMPALLDRRLDVALPASTPEEVDAGITASGDGAAFEIVPTPVIEQLTFQLGSDRESADTGSGNDELDYRRAVATAIDRGGILDETEVPWLPEIPGMLIPRGSSPWSRYVGSRSEARDLVDSSGLEAPAATLTTTGNDEDRVRIGDALASRFSDIGVGYRPIYQDSVLFYGETLTEGTFDIGMWAWISDGGYDDTLRLFDTFDPTSTVAGADIGRWAEAGGSESFSEIAAEVRSVVDPERFDELTEKAEDILADQLPLVPLFFRSAIAVWWPDVAAGIIPNGSVSDLTWNLETWQRVGE